MNILNVVRQFSTQENVPFIPNVLNYFIYLYSPNNSNDYQINI